MIQTAHQWFALLNDPAFDIRTVRICTDDVMEVVTTQAEEYQKSFKTNVFIAVFMTTHARLKLYEALETLQERVLYYHTDSIIYRWRPGQTEIPLGSFLGQFTDELEGDPIVEFVSGSTKNYGYLTQSGHTECKVRGFSLNYRTKQKLNYETMKQKENLKELDDLREIRQQMDIVDKNFFDGDQTTKCIHLIGRIKRYGLVFEKCVIDRSTRKSYLYGYCRILDINLFTAFFVIFRLELFCVKSC